MKVTNEIRDRILSDERAVTLDEKSCLFLGRVYEYKPITQKEHVKSLNKLIDWAKKAVYG